MNKRSGAFTVLVRSSSVMSNGVRVTARYHLRAPYLLMVGSLEPRKNFDVVARAWAEAGPTFDGLTLAVVGDTRPTLQAAPPLACAFLTKVSQR